MTENKIELRRLCTRDLFPMMKILSKIGIAEFRKCFESVSPGADLRSVGVGVMLQAADILLKNIGSCEKEIYSFLADLSGISAKDIPELEMAEFAEMITELVTKEEFKDFFTVVSKLIPTEK